MTEPWFYCKIIPTLYAQKKDNLRIEGKGRRCCMGDRIESIPCRAGYFAPGWFEEKDEFILFFKSSWCNSSYSSFRIVLNSQFGKELNQFFPLAATTFAFYSVFILPYFYAQNYFQS